jgi:NADP-dependent 3-hydroxy acid dehydrogenase YdfG
MKILVAGNPDYGLAAAIKQLFPTATFVSRTHGGWDLEERYKRKELAKLSLDYDVFISVSCLWHFYQTELVQEVALSWIEDKHMGYIIAIGSSADTPVKATAWEYPANKKALRAYCRQLSQIASSVDNTFKVTYLSPGNLHTPSQDEKLPGVQKLNCNYVAGIISWLIEQPTTVNISELCLDSTISSELL